MTVLYVDGVTKVIVTKSKPESSEETVVKRLRVGEFFGERALES